MARLNCKAAWGKERLYRLFFSKIKVMWCSFPKEPVFYINYTKHNFYILQSIHKIIFINIQSER